MCESLTNVCDMNPLINYPNQRTRLKQIKTNVLHNPNYTKIFPDFHNGNKQEKSLEQRRVARKTRSFATIARIWIKCCVRRNRS